MEGWVDLSYPAMHQPGVELATSRSQDRRLTEAPSRLSCSLQRLKLIHFTSLQVYTTIGYSVSQKNPPVLWQFFDQISRAYYVFLCTLQYEFLFNYLQLWRSHAILSMTTQFTSCVQNVHHRPKCILAFSDIFPKLLGIFSPNFTCLLNVHIYTRRQKLTLCLVHRWSMAGDAHSSRTSSRRWLYSA